MQAIDSIPSGLSRDLTAQIVAIVFAAGDPVSKDEITNSLRITKSDLVDSVALVNEQLRPLGLVLAQDDVTLQMITAPEVADIVREWGRALADTPLSPAAVEALSIVAYLPDVTKAEIDYIRGVNSAITMRTLGTRGLVRSRGEGDVARYQITVEALATFGCSSVRELPDWQLRHQQMKEQLGQVAETVVE